MLEPGVQSYNYRGTLETSKAARELRARERGRERGPSLGRRHPPQEAIPALNQSCLEKLCVCSWAEAEDLVYKWLR